MIDTTRFCVPTRSTMTWLAGLSLSVAGLLPQTMLAQRSAPRALTGQFAGAAHLLVSEPRGDFGDNTGNGVGLGVTGLWRLEPNGIANIRADLGFLTYGQVRQRIPLANTGGLVKLDLKTNSNIASFVLGPQIGGSTGAVSPYASALGGFSVFWTESSVEGSNNDNEPFASTTNASDFVWAYGGAVGMAIRLANGDRPVRLDGGARYLRHDDVRYLTKERVREAFDSNRDPVPVRGRADFVTYYLGVSVVVY